MEIDAVRLFVLASDLLNISAAGRQLGLAPAVASARLAKLEKQLGADLLHRSTRKVSLSLEGAKFLPYAREILGQADDAVAALGHPSGEVSGTIRFAASSTFAQLYVSPILGEFLERHPKLSLDLNLSDTPAKLIEGGFDIALRNFAMEDSALICRRLATDTRVLIASPGYAEQYGLPATPDDLVNHRLLIVGQPKPRSLISETAAAAVFPPPNASARLICNDGANIRQAVIGGAGIAMSSLWSVHNEICAGSLVRVLPDYRIDDGAAVWLVYPKSNALAPKVRLFIDFLIEKIGDPPIWDRHL